MASQKASPRKIAMHEREARALELRKQGLPYDQIATKVGLSKNGAWKAIQRALTEMVQEPAEELRNLELARLDDMQRGIWTSAKKGNVHAIDRVVRISERRSKLLGLDAPTNIKATVEGTTLDELEDLRKAAEANERAACSPAEPKSENETSAPSS